MEEAKSIWDEEVVGAEGKFVKLLRARRKELVLTDWRKQTVWMEKDKDGKPTDKLKKGITFSVISEDGKPCNPPKELTVTSQKALVQLKEIGIKAENEKKAFMHIAVTREGEGKGTNYFIEEIV